MNIQVGDIVRHRYRDTPGIGLVVDWYDSVNGFVYVKWCDTAGFVGFELHYRVDLLELVSRPNIGETVKNAPNYDIIEL